MDKTLIIYDTTGYIISSVTGFYHIPTGIPYIETEIPEGKRIATNNGIGVDVSVTPHQVILEDIPLTEMEELKNKSELQEQALAELTMYISMLGV